MTDNSHSFRWGVDLFDNEHTQIPNWVLAYYHRVGVTNTEMMFIIHLASFKYESANSVASPSLTKTLRERMGYKSNQGIINVQEGLVKKGLLIVRKQAGKRSLYDFTPFSKKVIKIALREELAKEDEQAADPSTKLDESDKSEESNPSTKLDEYPSTKLDDTRQQNLTRRREEEKNLIREDSSANADFSSPVSLLKEKEVRLLRLTLTEWKQYLEDERAERERKGVIKFIEGKVQVGLLLPDTEASKKLFEKLAVEAEAKGRRPPEKFPTLACKVKFDKASGRMNGTLETAIDKGLEQGITAIPKLVSYISSDKWQGVKSEHQNSAETGLHQGPGGDGESSQGAGLRGSPKYKRMQANGGRDPRAFANARAAKTALANGNMPAL